MITYAERACFHPSHLRVLARAQVLVSRVSDAWGNELRCHELARAVQRVLGDHTLVVVDGHCGPVDHSWIRFSDGSILDVYVPGRLPSVQIVDAIVAVAYRAGEPRHDVRRSILDKLVTAMHADLGLYTIKHETKIVEAECLDVAETNHREQVDGWALARIETVGRSQRLTYERDLKIPFGAD